MADIAFDRFGGLDLIQDPQEAGAERAISCLNVTLDRNGRVRSRDGYRVMYESSLAGAPHALYPVSISSDVVLVAFAGQKVRAIDISAGTSSGEVALASQSSSFAAAGAGVYFTDSTSTQIRKFESGAFSSPAGLATYEGNYLAVQPLEDRLVIADANSTSKLWFSDPDTPETIDTSNFVELTPGDGEVITGLEVFGTELFVFKQTKFFVFHGNSTDSTGGAVFNYRMVDTGVGCNATFFGGGLSATHETGVYFVGHDGVYRTTGGPPVKVSAMIDPMFTNMNLPVPAAFSSVISDPMSIFQKLDIARDHLFLFALAQDLATRYQFVLDLRSGAWTVYDLPAASMLDGRLVANGGSIILGVMDSTGKVGKHDDSFTTDGSDAFLAGDPIAWHHQSGFYDLGSQDSKRTRQTVVWGSGSPTVSVFTDHGTSDANAAAVTLGTAPAVARGWHRKSYRGVLFSHKLSGTTAATVHRIAHTVADARQGR